MKNQDPNIAGMTPFSTLDYPGGLAAVLHFQGCPLSCVYCHSAHLQPQKTDCGISWMQLIEFIKNRRDLLDAIILSGGEPCGQYNLERVIEIIKSFGLKVGLHTAGIFPEKLSRIINYIDWVGLDIKSAQTSWFRVTNKKIVFRHIEESLDILLNSNVLYEIRTTWHPAVLSTNDMIEIAEFLASKKVDRWVIRNFWSGGTAPDNLRLSMKNMAVNVFQQLTAILPGTEII